MLACTKRPYPTAVAAALALRRIRDASPRLREVGIYPCSACRAFHLTSHTAGSAQSLDARGVHSARRSRVTCPESIRLRACDD